MQRCKSRLVFTKKKKKFRTSASFGAKPKRTERISADGPRYGVLRDEEKTPLDSISSIHDLVKR